jgi:hypothetical protein
VLHCHASVNTLTVFIFLSTLSAPSLKMAVLPLNENFKSVFSSMKDDLFILLQSSLLGDDLFSCTNIMLICLTKVTWTSF